MQENGRARVRDRGCRRPKKQIYRPISSECRTMIKVVNREEVIGSSHRRGVNSTLAVMAIFRYWCTCILPLTQCPFQLPRD